MATAGENIKKKKKKSPSETNEGGFMKTYDLCAGLNLKYCT